MLLRFLIFFIAICNNLAAQKAEAVKDYNSGLEYYNLKNYESAISFVKEAIKKDPDFLNAHRLLLYCYEQSAKEEEIKLQYEKCIVLSPADKTLVFNFSQFFLKRKDYEKAALWLRKALEIDPTYEKASKSLQSIEEFLKNKSSQNSANDDSESNTETVKIYNEALELYKNANYQETVDKLKIIITDAKNPAYPYLLAISYQQLGQPEEAIKAFELVLELDDRHFDANLALATIYFNRQKYSDAVPLLQTAYDRRKNDRKVLLILAKATYKIEDFQNALNYLTSYIEMVSDDADAYFMLYKTYERLGDKKKAASAFEQAKKYGANTGLVSELNNDAAEYNRKAAEQSKNGNLEGAIQILEEAVSKHSEMANLHFNLALNYLEIGNKEKAATEFAKTIKLDSNHTKAYQSLATLYYDKAEYNSAIIYYSATLKKDKVDAYVEYKLGNCYFNLSQFSEALPHYKKASESGIREKQFFYALALNLLKLREFKASISALEEAVSIDPEFWDAHYHICINYVELNESQKVLDRAKLIVEKNPAYARAYLAMSMAYKKLGNLADADKSKQMAIKLDPGLK